ncbi:hypothetical protein A1Q2_04846 [Trichosporon asahii var. asahii CBS 8904]|uniref:Signal peptidase complex catalytic subunit SEC11 n=1 Tax=Trichosporon asahii var. asahii (strain CBS 8904) TaxID=1220162 RepID=K1VJ77_TRIAC|nr:hypothetical protein A1Q2_04846 [Trichosporon asahii var. asahii CBS 8904]
MFGEEIAKIRKLGVHGVLFQLLNFLNVVASGLVMWKALCLVTNSESPIVVVLSPGDPLGTPIVHRVIESHTSNTTQLLLTKGDNNPTDDFFLYKGPQWLDSRQIVGKVVGFLPYLGYVTIAMNDFPQLKYALLGTVGAFLLLNRDHSS